MPGTRLPEEERREAILAGAYDVAVRDTLAGLSMRAVSEAAGVSKGLVFFHFDDKKTLLLALLDWVLDQGPRVEVPPGLDEGSHPARRLLELVGHQIALLEERPERVELFLDFWVMGTGLPEMRTRIQDAFERYREQFLPYTTAVVEALPERFEGGHARGLAAAVVSFIEGCALQFMADPESFDVDQYMDTVRALVLGD